MNRRFGFHSVCVKILALCSLVVMTACSLTQPYYEDPCNNRAYIQTVMADYISNRFHSNAPVRMAVIPFSVPANLAGKNAEIPGLGNELAWKVQEDFIGTEVFPIVEILNRQDWPGKKAEFFTGNFGAIAAARDAGYDLVFVGMLDTITSVDILGATTKLIETESGTTLWFGQTTVKSNSRAINRSLDQALLTKRNPSIIETNQLKDGLAACIVRGVVDDGMGAPKK
ncbi:MAG: hypothetical protein J0M12_08335 [Deltaproteobacteria bacterium]|nr:hypothetical protein [Deltaproteobacteria bacterium]